MIKALMLDKIFYSKLQLSLFLILIGALLLRIWGIDFGLPHIYHTDEWFEVKRALKLGAGVFDFERISKGGYFYLLFVEYGIYFVILKLFGLVRSADQFLLSIFKDPTDIWLIGRLTTAVIGTLNCYLMYLMGRFAYSRIVGVSAALFLAVHLIHVKSSHYITVDIPLVTLITLCFVIIFYKPSNRRPGQLQYALLGFVYAAAVMTKIPGAVVLFSVILFHWKNLRDENTKIKIKHFLFEKRIIVLASVAALIYIIGNPGFAYKIKEYILWFLSFFDTSPEALKPSKFPLSTLHESFFAFYLKTLFPWKYLAINILVFLGFILSFRKKVLNTFILLAAAAPYVFFLFSSKKVELVYARYTLPLVPIMGIYFGIACEYLTDKMRKKTAGLLLVATFISAALVPALYDVFIFNSNKLKPDTRTIAEEWVNQNVKQNEIIILEGSYYHASPVTVPLKINPVVLDEISSYDDIQKEADKRNIFYRMLRESLENQKTYHLILTYNESQMEKALADKNGDFIILRENLVDACDMDQNRQTFQTVCRLVSWANSDEFKLLQKFEKNADSTGPTLILYQRNKGIN